MKLCNEQLTNRPSDTYALWYLGSALFRLGEVDAATTTFRKLVELEPGWDESHVQPILSKMEKGELRRI